MPPFDAAKRVDENAAHHRLPVGCIDQRGEALDQQIDPVAVERLLDKWTTGTQLLAGEAQGGANLGHGKIVGSTQAAQRVEFDQVPKRERQRGLLRGRYQRVEEPRLVALASMLAHRPGANRRNRKRQVV